MISYLIGLAIGVGIWRFWAWALACDVAMDCEKWLSNYHTHSTINKIAGLRAVFATRGHRLPKRARSRIEEALAELVIEQESHRIASSVGNRPTGPQ